MYTRTLAFFVSEKFARQVELWQVVYSPKFKRQCERNPCNGIKNQTIGSLFSFVETYESDHNQ